MTSYTIKNVDTIAGLMTMTILGNGNGLKNDLNITDDNNNKFIIKSIAMAGGKSDLSDETVIVIAPLSALKPIGTRIYVQ